MRRWPLLLLLPLSGCAPYFANLAREFGGVLTSSSTDLSPMMRNLSLLCRRHADLAYLRSRLEDPVDRALVPWQNRLTSLYSGRSASFEARCAEMDQEVDNYRLMHAALLSYGASLRALAETQSYDFRDSFTMMGDSLSRLAVRMRPTEPELGRVMVEGSDAINKVLRLAISARSERDIKRAIQAAAVPVRHLINRLERVVHVYRDQVGFYSEAQDRLLDKVERSTLPLAKGMVGRTFDVLAFYEHARRVEEEKERIKLSTKVYLATLGNIRNAHEAMVSTASGRIPPKQALNLVNRNTRDLFIKLQAIYDQIDSLLHRGRP